MSEALNLFEQMVAALPPDFPYEVPPKVFYEMEGEIVDVDMAAKTLTATFPVLERHLNIAQNMQGGIIVAAIDNTMGPLSFLFAGATVTTQLNTSYIRPIPATLEHIVVVARVTEQTKRWLYLSAEVQNPEGKVLTIAHATNKIVEM